MNEPHADPGPPSEPAPPASPSTAPHGHAPPAPVFPGENPTGRAAPVTLPPPPSVGKQVLQLVLIPAVICLSALAVITVLGLFMAKPDTLEDNLARLRQGSGAGRMAMGMQDPRYKDRGMAAANIAQMLPGIEDPARRAEISAQLLEVLEHNVGPEEDLLQVYLCIAVGQLGQPAALPVLQSRLDSSREQIRQGGVRGLMSWMAAQDTVDDRALAALRLAVADQSPAVAADAAAGLGQFAPPGDEASIAALRTAMGRTGLENREVQWNAAVALARLGNEQGAEFVANTLLNRDALAEMPAATSGPLMSQTMPTALQDRVILSTLAGVVKMRDPAVWNRVKQLADSDSSRTVQKAAQQVMQARQEQAPR